MAQAFDLATIDALAGRSGEPAWVTELRRKALAAHQQLPWPHPSDDIWRRTDVSLLDPLRGFAPRAPAPSQAAGGLTPQLEAWARPLGEEHVAVRVDGAWKTQAWPKAISVEELSRAARTTPGPIRQVIEADGLTPSEQKLASLNLAFHHDALFIAIPPGFAQTPPLRLVRAFTVEERGALFPLTVITIGAGSAVTLIDESMSAPSGRTDAPHLVNGRIELVVGDGASVHYVRLQRWATTAREFLLQRATLARGASLTLANLHLGGSLSKAHLVTRLMGEHASTRLYGFVFGQRGQHVDQHTLQDHQAPHTTSDLQFRAALQDDSRMVYTGLIRIASCAKQTQAYQANHNLLLSQHARAETIPMLEILADDVQCKHGASIGPIDEEQAFYLMSRGVPREAAQRLIVMGFVEPMIQQVPFAPLQERLRAEIEGGLHG